MNGKVILAIVLLGLIFLSYRNNEAKKEEKHYRDAYYGWLIETNYKNALSFQQWKALYGNQHKP